jgi:hypothetical protein
MAGSSSEPGRGIVLVVRNRGQRAQTLAPPLSWSVPARSPIRVVRLSLEEAALPIAVSTSSLIGITNESTIIGTSKAAAETRTVAETMPVMIRASRGQPRQECNNEDESGQRDRHCDLT